MHFSQGKHGKWVLKAKISQGNLQQARGIAVFENGCIAIADEMQKCVLKYFLSVNGVTSTHLIRVGQSDMEEQLGLREDDELRNDSWRNDDYHKYVSKVHTKDVAVTSRGRAVAIFMPKEYSNNLVIAAEGPNRYYTAISDSHDCTCVTADSSGLIYTGHNGYGGNIKIFAASTGKFVKRISNDHMKDVRFIACTQNTPRKLLATHDDGLKMYDLEGKTLFHVNPSIGGTGGETAGKAARALGVTCDEDDNVYLAVSFIEDNTGHIHKYSPTLVFQECIAQGLLQPQGMDYAKGCLYVANSDSFLVFRQENLNAEQQASQQ